MNIETMRPAFEAWAIKADYSINQRREGPYVSIATEGAWQGWQAKACDAPATFVSVAKLEGLITYHCGMMVKEPNADIIDGAATVVADLEDLVAEAKDGTL